MGLVGCGLITVATITTLTGVVTSPIGLALGAAAIVMGCGLTLVESAGMIFHINTPLSLNIISRVDDLTSIGGDLLSLKPHPLLIASIAITGVRDVLDNVYPPAQPQGLAVFPRYGQVKIFWATPLVDSVIAGHSIDSAIMGHNIRRDDGKIMDVVNRNSYFDDLATPGSTYCYQVRAFYNTSEKGPFSDWSAQKCGTVPTIAPPAVTTRAAINVTSSSATLAGSVNPNGSVTTAYFEYGTSASYGNSTLAQDVGNGTSLINLTGNLSNLVPNTTYHYTVVARNSDGSITRGSDQTFRSVTPVTAAPTISSVFPGTVTGSNSAQPFTINGTNFIAGARVTLRDKRTGEVFPNRQPSSFTNTSITLNPVFTTASGTWSVNVVNPDNSSTGEYVFSVVAPTGGPLSFASLSPSVVETNAIEIGEHTSELQSR